MKMRCIVSYKDGPFYGTLDFGVSSERDGAVDRELAKLRDRGASVLSVRFG